MIFIWDKFRVPPKRIGLLVRGSTLCLYLFGALSGLPHFLDTALNRTLKYKPIRVTCYLVW